MKTTKLTGIEVGEEIGQIRDSLRGLIGGLSIRWERDEYKKTEAVYLGAKKEFEEASKHTEAYRRWIGDRAKKSVAGQYKKIEVLLPPVCQSVFDQRIFGVAEQYKQIYLPPIVSTLTKPKEETTKEITLREKEAFLRMEKEGHFKKYPKGRFIAILKGEQVADGDDIIKLAINVYKKHDYHPIYIGQVGVKEMVVRIPSRRIHR